MAKKDIAEKILMSYTDVFADIVNVLIFKGEQVVKPDELEEMNTWEGYKAVEGLHYMERDVAKWWRKNDIRIACVGFENMTAADSRMVLRVYGYDGAEYRIQCTDENRKKPAYPVVTLVLHFGTERRWKDSAPMSLYETVEVPTELKPYVTNVKINVFDIAWLTPKQVSMFKSDFGMVADYFVKKRKGIKYDGSTAELKHVYEVLELLSVVEDDDRYKKAYYSQKIEGGIHNMCDVLDRVEQMGAEKMEKEMKKQLSKQKAEMEKDFSKQKTEMEKDFSKQKTEMEKDFSRQELLLKETFAKKMLAAGRPQSEVVEFSELSRARVAKLAKAMAVAGT